MYEICDVAAPTSATNDATLTTEPPPRSSRCGIPCLQQRKTPLRVHGEHALPRLDRRLEDARVVGRRDACVVVEHVDSAEALGGRSHQSRDLLLLGDVDLEREGLAVAELDCLLRGVPRDVGDADARAFAGEEDSRLASHAAAGAGDHRDLSVKASHQPVG